MFNRSNDNKNLLSTSLREYLLPKENSYLKQNDNYQDNREQCCLDLQTPAWNLLCINETKHQVVEITLTVW